MSMFPFTLWHGTSAHLLPTIKEHGLGGRNVMEDWRVIDFLKWAWEIVGDAYDNHYDDLDLFVIKSAIGGTATHMNFEYGDVYVAGGFHKAADYSLNSPELMSFVKAIMEAADRIQESSLRNGLSNYPEIAEFLSLAPKPVVLKLPPMPMSAIASEKGGEVQFPSDPTNGAAKAFYSQMAYRVTSVVPFDGIEVFDTSDHKRSFSL